MIPLHDLKPGQIGLIEKLLPSKLSLKLQELGCLPGRKIRIQCVAPLGDPICVRVNGFSLSLRKADAAVLQVKPI